MTSERRTADGTDVRDRIDEFLAAAGVTGARVVPLTGDASDRRYFRVLLRDEPSQVLAVHPGAIEFEGMPFVNVARLLAAMPVPVPRILGHSDALGIIALDDLGDVTRSEEHTSELQSQSNLVCRLLLEKKKKPVNHPYPPESKVHTNSP